MSAEKVNSRMRSNRASRFSWVQLLTEFRLFKRPWTLVTFSGNFLGQAVWSIEKQNKCTSIEIILSSVIFTLASTKTGENLKKVLTFGEVAMLARITCTFWKRLWTVFPLLWLCKWNIEQYGSFFGVLRTRGLPCFGGWDRTISYSHYWTGTSLQLRLMLKVILNANGLSPFNNISQHELPWQDFWSLIPGVQNSSVSSSLSEVFFFSAEFNIEIRLTY